MAPWPWCGDEDRRRRRAARASARGDRRFASARRSTSRPSEEPGEVLANNHNQSTRASRGRSARRVYTRYPALNGNSTTETSDGPVLLRDEYGAPDYDSIPDVIQWFVDYDQRVAIIKHPKVEELFHWKQQQSQEAGEDVFNFSHAEDRLAIGIIQSIAHHPDERALHGWIAQLLNALN